MKLRRLALVVLLVLWAGVGVRPNQSAGSLPSQLSNEEFWRLVAEMSEPNGYFRSENFLSNENAFQQVIPDLTSTVGRGSVYLGVGPEQNFTYIAALQPKMA